MNGMKKLSVILLLLSLTACASRVQRTVYYDYRPPVSHTSVHATVHRYQPIEVTVYADHAYRGGFTTIRLVLVDGDYAEIPMRNKTGHYSRIFAHYHAGSLHFDADKNCHGLRGASRLKQDNGWHKGRIYTRVSAGKDYDLTGLKLMVRHVDSSRKPGSTNNDQVRHEKDRNMHPEHADLDKNSPVRDRLPKGVQKQSLVGKNISVSQKITADRDDARVNNKPVTTARPTGTREKAPDARSQAVNRLDRESDQEKRHDPVAKVRKSLAAKADRGEDKDAQNIKLSKNEPPKTVARQAVDERTTPAVKKNALEKTGMTQVGKTADRHQPKVKENPSAAEKKQAQKNNKGKKNKDVEDDSDEDNSPDDEHLQGKGRTGRAT